MPIRDNDPRPAYQQLADELRQAIAAGRYEVGDRLPSTRELSESHGIAPMTVRAALGVLEDEALVVPRQGRGVFVARVPEPPDDALAGPGELASVRQTLQETMKLLQRVNDRLDRIEAAGRGAQAGRAAGTGVEPAAETEPIRGADRTGDAARSVDDTLDAALEDLKAIEAALDAADTGVPRVPRPQVGPSLDPGPPPAEPDLGIDL